MDFVIVVLGRSRRFGHRRLVWHLLWHNSFWHGPRGLRRRRRWRRSQFFVRQACRALEAAAQFLEAFRAADVSTLGVNLLQLRGEFRGAAGVPPPQNQIHPSLVCLCVPPPAPRTPPPKNPPLLCFNPDGTTRR